MLKKLWKDLKINKKLGFVIGLMGLVMILQLFVLIFAMNILSTTRILVAGEGYWSKAQKDSVAALISYVVGQEQEYYVKFKKFIQIPLGDRIARLELMQEDYNHKIAYDGFVQGNNHPSDINTAITNIRRFRTISGMSEALHEWEKADAAIDKLIILAEKIHVDLKIAPYSQIKIKSRLNEIALLDKELTEVEYKFSLILGEVSREIENFITWSLLFAVLTVISIGFIIMRSFNFNFTEAIDNLRFGITQVKKGNFNETLPIHSYDEFGELAQEINEMFISLKEQIAGRQTAEESQSRLAVLADAMPLIVYIMAPDSQITFCNKRFWDFLGLPPNDPSKISWEKIVHPDDISLAEKAFFNARNNNTTCVCEIRVKNSNGNYTWFLVRTEPICNENGELTHWYGTMIDISEQRYIRDALQNAIKVRDEFLSIASHELKTPLTSLLLQTQLRKRYIGKGEHHRFTPDKLIVMKNDDEKQLNRLINLVDEMLDISRIQNGKLTIRKTRFSFTELLHEVVSRFELQAQEHNTTITIDSEVDSMVNWDRYRLQQVIENLLTNALKYGNQTPIKIRVEANPDKLTLYVKDQGPGVSELDSIRIFEQFERAITPSEASGLGLGLYIVKKIVLAHNGTIRVRSKLGEGSEFIVEIPL